MGILFCETWAGHLVGTTKKIQFNNQIKIQLSWIWIQLKKSGMQIDGENIENFACEYGFGKKNFYKTQIWKDKILCLFTWKWVK